MQKPQALLHGPVWRISATLGCGCFLLLGEVAYTSQSMQMSIAKLYEAGLIQTSIALDAGLRAALLPPLWLSELMAASSSQEPPQPSYPNYPEACQGLSGPVRALRWLSGSQDPGCKPCPGQMVDCMVCGGKEVAKRRPGYRMTCADCTQCQAMDL